MFWFLCQAEKTRAVDLLSELEGSIWVARSWFSFSFILERTLNQTARVPFFLFVRFLVALLKKCFRLNQVVDDDRDARRSIKEVLKTYSKAMLLRIWQRHCMKSRGAKGGGHLYTMRIKQNMLLVT